VDLNAINRMDSAVFIDTFGNVFEHSPWVARSAWNAQPFATYDTLYQAMFDAVRHAPTTQILDLLRAHPDLAGKEAQEGTMTTNSVSEQASAGLDALSRDEMQSMQRLNAAYRAKHGFPFIIAVRNYSKSEIFKEFERRLQHDTEIEFHNNLEQIFDIVGMRLDRLLSRNSAQGNSERKVA
jgi:2-oxo-4-hydroxy-4-carboxy-5-ureidoimidazoline decarboxylase